jgi:hypothetical protein
MHTFVDFSRLGVQKDNKSIEIYVEIKIAPSPLSNGMAVCRSKWPFRSRVVKAKIIFKNLTYK